MENRILDIHCPRCGAPAEYNVVRGRYVCAYCDGEFTSEIAQREKQGFRKMQGERLQESVKKYKLFRASCTGCGAQVVFEENEALSSCAFCGRSLVRKDIEYIYTDHGVSSDNLTLRTHALDHFDTLFCVGPHQMEEARAIEKLYGLKARRCVQVGYGLLDEMTEAWEQTEHTANAKKTILIGPSWQKDNIMDSCIDALVEQFSRLDCRIIIRPHPQYVRLYGDRIEALIQRYQDRIGEDFVIQTDFSSTDTVYSADLLVTDWSNVGYEFALSTLKPVLYINTPMKVMNPEYDKIDVVPFDIRIRAQLGGELELSELDRAGEVAGDLLSRPEEFREIIQAVKEKEIYNLGRGAEAAGRYLVRRIEDIEARRG